MGEIPSFQSESNINFQPEERTTGEMQEVVEAIAHAANTLATVDYNERVRRDCLSGNNQGVQSIDCL